jgi:O6-methylguanine-DNA--protein-cysteine methyltransferase
MDLSGLPEFQSNVLNALLRVRRGEVKIYSWLAQRVRNPQANQAPGNA